MMGMTLIFFSESFHVSMVQKLRHFFNKNASGEETNDQQIFHKDHPTKRKIIFGVLVVYFILQVIIPFRYLLYPGKLLWTEEGYRFSWRVMLMEKSGTAFFYVKDPQTGGSSEVNTRKFLTAFQEKNDVYTAGYDPSICTLP